MKFQQKHSYLTGPDGSDWAGSNLTAGGGPLPFPSGSFRTLLTLFHRQHDANGALGIGALGDGFQTHLDGLHVLFVLWPEKIQTTGCSHAPSGDVHLPI